ncbi:alkene reductase [Legionella sp. WA2022007384]
MNTLKLISPLNKLNLQFKNRVFMAPMTRSRATTQIPNDLMAEYYAQRASAGLIFTEGTQISPEGIGYIFTPGIYTEEQIKGWQKVTQAVHENGGQIFAQLWHVGRVSHPDFQGGKLPVAPSAISFKGQAFTLQGPKDTLTPRALLLDEIKNTIEEYRKAAEAAQLAGFDGVEIHGANGYLPHQFLEDGSNHRDDMYGGSLENRARFLLEVTDAAISVWGPERVSVRLSPRNPFNGMSDSTPEQTYLYVVEQLEKRKLGILHFMEPTHLPKEIQPLAPQIRKIFSGILVLNMGYTKETAEEVLSQGLADAISFGSLFIGNPDLPVRFTENAPLTVADNRTYYGGGKEGYTDYPRLR